MNIVIVANFCGKLDGTDNDRFVYLAKLLSENNQVELITSNFCHEWKAHREKLEQEWPFEITCVDEPGYPRNVCLKRFWSHYKWGREVFKYLKKRKRPDVVYCAVPSLTGARYAARYCEKNDVRFIIDVQDLWPEAFQMALNVPIVKQFIFLPFRLIANGVYKRANDIVAVSSTYLEKAKKHNKKCGRTLAVYIGTDLEAFDKNARSVVSLVKDKGSFWIGYCGTLGKSYDLNCVIDAIQQMPDHKASLIVMGDGPLLEDFKNRASNKCVSAFFLGRLPYETMCAVLTMCDVVVNPINGLSVASIINKHADYAAVGRPVLNTQNSNEYISLIKKYEMGYSVDSGDSVSLAYKISELQADADIRDKMGNNARICAEERFNRSKTYPAIVKLIEEVGNCEESTNCFIKE